MEASVEVGPKKARFPIVRGKVKFYEEKVEDTEEEGLLKATRSG